MAEAIDTETHKKIADVMNQTDLTSEIDSARQQMVELQPLLSSHPSDPSHNHLQQQQQKHMGDQVMVDIETMIEESGDGLVLQECCISRVVCTMRDIKPDAYTPRFVSIGPFHYGNEKLQDMERHKGVWLKRFMQRSKTGLEVLTSYVKSSVPRVRVCYSEDIDLSDGELVKLILVDAAFIIELFFNCCGETCEYDDAKMSQLSVSTTLPLDLILLENQLPFFVFEGLFHSAFREEGDPTFHQLACKFFCEAFHLEKPEVKKKLRVRHFTDLLGFLLLQNRPTPKMDPYVSTTDILCYSAKELQEFGVEFKASKSKSLLDIKFSGHVLELPPILVVDVVTEVLFQNMIAFEQNHCPFTSYITSYCSLLSGLISTKEDVSVLGDKKIMRRYMPDTEVITLFRIMSKNAFLVAMVSEYIDISKRLNKFCENGLRQSKATLRRDYCRTPWQTVASFAGIILLILTTVQTIFSVLQVIAEKK